MSQTQPKCIITGCDLVATDTEQIVHGDLWKLGDVYIFNSFLNNGEASWRDNDGPTSAQDDKIILIKRNGRGYFERRGVFVVSKAVAVLSPAAQEYINEGALR